MLVDVKLAVTKYAAQHLLVLLTCLGGEGEVCYPQPHSFKACHALIEYRGEFPLKRKLRIRR